MFLLLKLPSAFITGVRLKTISEDTCITSVKHRWINQNPFKSMFWAVQGMAAELSTGAMMMIGIEKSGHKISMLVASNKATFIKKAKGRITFTCRDGNLVKGIIDNAIISGESQTLWMKSEGRNSTNEIVSVFEFEWTIKVKASKF